MRVGVDTGGTFTDAVCADGRMLKVPSTPDDPSRAVAAVIATVGGVERLDHGTTVATNALLERRGATVALVTTEGFTDVIEIGRQDRPSLYDAWADRPAPLVPRALRLAVSGRLAADGSVLVPLGPVPVVPEGVESVAVCLLHSDLDPAHERAVAAELRRRGHDVTASSEVAPEFREYERTVTTAVNAYLRPACRPYLSALAAMAPAVDVLTSAGGLVPLDEAALRPAALLVSGPAAGVLAAAAAAVAAGFPDAVTFDMGGTSTDVCLVRDGRPAPAAERTVAGLPVRLPSLDVHTIGAGGGSVAALDSGGALVVGPRSAGAVPGPACYGRGGTEPTVTDADLAAARLGPGTALPGIGTLSIGAARSALASAGVEAEGVITVVDAAMVEAVRAVTVRRGVDPATLALVAFGGAGPLHACAMAGALGMAAVVVPPRAGVLSAVGLLGSARQADLVRSWPAPADHAGVEAALRSLGDEARRRLATADGSEVMVETAVDCRYAGQGHELTVASVAGFEDEHARVNGYRRPGTPVEVIALRATARAPSEVAPAGAGPSSEVAPAGAGPSSEVAPASAGPSGPARRPLTGPAAVAEPDCAVWVPAGWRAEVHPSGAWIITPARP